MNALVNYLPSQATKNITVTSLDAATNLTITAPSTIPQGQPFIVSGVLKRSDTGSPLAGEEISLSYNGTSLGTTQTQDQEGSIKYQIQVQIDTVGTFTLRANFAGSTRPGLVLRPSMAQTIVGVPGDGAMPDYTSAFILGAVLLGTYFLIKRR